MKLAELFYARLRQRRRVRPLRRTLVFESLESRLLLSVGLIGVPIWAEQGPGPIHNGNNVIMTDSPQAGAVEAIAVDPANAARVFIATVDGGVWRTSNATAANPNWTPLTDQFPSLSMGDIEFSPLDATNNTLFAGVGRFSNGRGDGGSLTGVLRTADGGDTWAQLGTSTFNGLSIQTVVPTALSIAGQQVVLAGTVNNNGLYRSADNGGTWTQISGAFGSGLPLGAVTDIIADSANNMRFYAALPNQGVFRSTDGGVTWASVNTGLTGLSGSSRIELAIHNTVGNNVVYAAVVDGTGVLSNVFRSADQGANWAAIDTVPNVSSGSQGGSNLAIVADPTDPNIVYVSGDRGPSNNAGNLFRGDAGANTWTELDNAGANNTAPHPDSRDMIFDSGGSILESNDGGIYRLIHPNGGGTPTWSSMIGDLADTEFYGVSYDSVNNVIFGGAQDNGSPEQNSPGSFTWTDQSGADGTLTAVDNTSNANHSIQYFATQNFGGFTRITFDNTHTPVNTHPISLVVSGTGGQNLFQVEAQNPGGSTIRFVQPYALNAVDPTRLIIGTNFLYESTDQGDTLTSLGGVMATGGGNFKPINPVGSVDPVGSVNIHTSPIAYGGMAGGVANAEVLWVGANGQLLERSSGTGLPTVLNAYTTAGGTTVMDIVLDPDNWHRAFVVDSSGKIWETTDTGATWSDLTGNLASLSTDLRTVQLIKNGSTEVLLTGGNDGVFRTINPTTGSSPTWFELGANLPNSVVKDLEYDRTDDVLVAGLWGRGAWTISSASTNVSTPGVLQINGDTDFAGEDDTIRLIRDGNNPLLLDAFLNNATSVPTLSVPIAALQQINVNGLGGNDTLIADSTNGLINVPLGIRYDGGTGFDRLNLLQTDGPTQTSDTYSVGPTVGEGISTIVGSGGGGTQTVFFGALSPVLDLVPTATLTVNATPADNAINYSVGSLVTQGLVTIDNQESIEFANKTALIVNAGAGTDTIGVNNPNTPTGLGSLTVNGGDPTSGDTLIVTGTGGPVTVNTVTGLITGATGAGAGVPITFATIETLALPAGIGALTLTTTGADDTLEVTPGVGSNGGTLTSNGVVPVISFANAGPVTANLGGGADTVVVNGSAVADTIAVGGTAVTIAGRNAVSYTGAEVVTVNGLGGNDTFNVTPAAGVGIFIDGGDPISTLPGDALSVAAGGGTVTFTSGPTPDSGSFAVTGDQPVSFTHIESASVTGATAAVINGTAGPDTITVTARDSSTSAGADGVQDFTTAINAGPTVLFLNVPLLTVNALDGSDEVVLQAPAPNNAVWNVAVTINGGPPAASDTLVVQTPGAAAETAVYTPTAVDGGTLNLSSLTSLVTFTSIEQLVYDGQGDNDSLTVVGTSGNDTLVHTPGLGNQDGTVRVNSLLALSYQNLGTGASLTLDGGAGTDTLVVNGTEVNDSFTVAATGAITLNGRLMIATLSIEALTLEGLGGDDTFTLPAAISGSPYPTVNLDGGPQASAAGDRVNLIGTTGNDTFILNGSQVTQGAVTVNLSGIESGQLDAQGGSDVLIYNGVSGVAEAITVSSSGVVGGGQLGVPAVLLLTFTNLETIDVNGNPGVGGDEDTLTFAGTNGADLFQINLAAAGTDADPILKLQNASAVTLLTLRNYTNFNTLHVNGLDGADTFNVFTGPLSPVNRNLFIDGGLPSAKQKLTDVLNIFYTPPRPKIIASVATQDHDAGLVDLNYGTDDFLVQYTDIENVVIRKL